MTISGFPSLSNGMRALLPGLAAPIAPQDPSRVAGLDSTVGYGAEPSLADVVAGGATNEGGLDTATNPFARATSFLTQAAKNIDLPPSLSGFLAGAAIFLTPELSQAAVQSGEALANGGVVGSLQAFATLGAGALAMAARRFGSAEELSKAENEKLEEIYRYEPTLKKALAETGLSDQEQYDYLYMESAMAEMMERQGWDEDRIIRYSEPDHGRYDELKERAVAFNALAKTGWSFEEQRYLLFVLAEKMSTLQDIRDLPEYLEIFSMTRWAYKQQCDLLIVLWDSSFSKKGLAKLVKALCAKGYSFEEQRDLLIRLVKSSSVVKLLLQSVITHSSDEHVVAGLSLAHRLAVQLTDYNRERVVGEFLSSQQLFHEIGEEHYLQHLELYVTLFERWPRMGFNLLEGVFDATQKGLIPQDISAERGAILHFIQQTNGFIPSLYQAYLAEGESLLPKLQEQVSLILNDEFSSDDARRVIRESGDEYLLALIQIASPTSGASFVAKSEQLGLMRKMLEAGDLRTHIPESWRHRVESYAMERGGYRLGKGRLADPEGKIGMLLDQFRVSEDGDKIEEEDLIQALIEYLQSGRDEQHRGPIQARLYQLAGQNDALKEKIDRIQDREYSTLLLLEQLFGDKDNLQKLLAVALEKVPSDLLEQKTAKQKIEGDAKRLVKSLKKVWQNQKSGGREQRIVILGNMLKGYEAGDIEDKILTRSDLSDELKSAIREVMDLTPVLSQKQIIAEILADPIQLIRQEMAKYSYQDLGHITVGLRAVKGPTYGMNGLSSGVCTATDMELWQNPNFKLLAITDEAKGQVMGYIHVFETEIDGEKYLTLPGINPSAEFLGTVNARKLYDGIMAKVIAYAKAGDFHGVYIPTNPIVHSNRSDIQKAIKRAQYPTKKIPEVRWNTLPKPYPFDEVYVAWKA